MKTAFKVECNDCDQLATVIIGEGSALNEVENHRKETGHTLEIYKLVPKGKRGIADDDDNEDDD